VVNLSVEADLKREVVELLRALRWCVYVTSERRRGYSKMPRGWPDLFARHTGKRLSVWIECKRPGEDLLPEQEAFRLEALAAGERHWTLRSIGQLETELAKIGFVAKR
jgi:hypothetical protein